MKLHNMYTLYNIQCIYPNIIYRYTQIQSLQARKGEESNGKRRKKSIQLNTNIYKFIHTYIYTDLISAGSKSLRKELKGTAKIYTTKYKFIQIYTHTYLQIWSLQARKGKESNGKRRHSLSAKLSFLHL